MQNDRDLFATSAMCLLGLELGQAKAATSDAMWLSQASDKGLAA